MLPEWQKPDRGRATHSKFFRRTLRARPRFFHAAQADLAFLNSQGKKYGSFFVGKSLPPGGGGRRRPCGGGRRPHAKKARSAFFS